MSCGKRVAFSFKDRSYLTAGLFKIHFCSWGCGKRVAWERRKQGHWVYLARIRATSTTYFTPRQLHWSKAGFIGGSPCSWVSGKHIAAKKEFRATQVCYQRVLLPIEITANALHQNQKVLVKWLYLSYLRLCSWPAGDSGKCIATL